MNQQELAEQLDRILDTGTEEEATNFVVEHFKEFPADVQRELAVALYSDALEEDLAKREALAELKKEAIGAIEAMEKSEGQKN